MKKESNLYSLIIRPPVWIIELIKDMKMQLKHCIDWYPSSGSEAHLTLLEFKDDTELDLFIDGISAFCKTQSGRVFRFNSFAQFENGTFFIAPDYVSKVILENLVQDFYMQLGLSAKFYPHITIGRQLHTRNQMERTIAFFSNAKVDFSFVCESFVLRKFNSDKKQYSEIYRDFPFNSH